MQLPELVPAQFLQRGNRFRVSVEMEGQTAAAHLPNSGRLRELLIPGRPVWPAPAHKPGRRTSFDLQLVELETALVFVIQRADAVAFTPNRDADPTFAETLQFAVDAGVECRAFTCQISTNQTSIQMGIPVQSEVC